MRKIAAILTAGIMAIGLSACELEEGTGESGGTINYDSPSDPGGLGMTYNGKMGYDLGGGLIMSPDGQVGFGFGF